MKRSFGSRFLFVTVFSLALALATGTVAAQTANLLYSFKGQNDGGSPFANLITDSSGNLYGTTKLGGTYNHGAVFELINSSGSYSEKVLYSFTNSNGDGAQPESGLITDSSGNLYGTTYLGGADGYGTVYELVNSSGSYTERVLYSFTGQGDGAWPAAGLTMDSSGNLYGTTVGGGAQGWGAVFELLNSSGSYSERLLYSFNGAGDGALPTAGVILDSSGNLYGTAPYTRGNGFGNGYDNGVVFELVNSSGSYTEQVLYSFTANGDGGTPSAGLIMDSSGNLYGTTRFGGAFGDGTVFELINSSGVYSEKILYGFTGHSDGAEPYAGLIMDSAGDLYGTTFSSSVFELINTSGSYSFVPLGYCGNVGYNSYGGLIMDSSGILYGTMSSGGTYSRGTVFSLTNFSAPAAPTTTTVVSSSNPVNAGNPLFFTATVGSSFSVNTGTVTFSAGGTILGTSPVNCGTATVAGPEDSLTLGIGNITVTAQYNPVLPSLGPSSGTMNQTISEAGVVLTNGNNTLTGNETVSGNVNATTFVGNGSGLTNVLASGLNCAGCIDNSQLAVNYAASASQGGPASNALLFGGLLPAAFQPAGSYALDANGTVNAETAFSLGGFIVLKTPGGGTSSNLAVGPGALVNGTGVQNVAIGWSALAANQGGNSNTAVGMDAMGASTTGASNTAIGEAALEYNSSGSLNVANGTFALFTNTTGVINTALGSFALDSNTVGSSNTAVGYSAMNLNTTGGANSAVGVQALLSNTTGSYNSALGFAAGPDPNSPNLTNATAIGANSVVSESNALVLGGTGQYAVKVGIGTATPTNVLTIAQGAGQAIADGWTTYSSRRWKTNIQPLHDALATVEQLRGVSYDLKESGKHEIGVIAEEVGTILPEVVSWDKNGREAQGVDYSRLTALLIEAAKQQQSSIREQQEQIRQQQEQIDSLTHQLRQVKAVLEKQSQQATQHRHLHHTSMVANR